MSQELQKTTNSNNSLTQYNGQNSLIGDWIKTDTELAIAKTYAEKRIGDFTREDMTKLVEIMAQWRILLGVTSEPTEQELIIICQFMYDNFKKFTLADVRLAMNWAIGGRLDVGFVTQKNISSYYVSRVMNAYDDYKRHIFNDMMAEREKYRQRLEIDKPRPQTPKEKAETFKDFVVSMYKAYQNDSLLYDVGDSLYDWIKRTGQLNPTKEEVQAAVEYGKEKYSEVMRERNLRQILSEAVDNKTKEEQQKKFAREYIIRLYFERYTLGEIIKKIELTQF
jgi:hypothetical protein